MNSILSQIVYFFNKFKPSALNNGEKYGSKKVNQVNLRL